MKRCTVDAMGRIDAYFEEDITFTASGASGVLILKFLDASGAWKADIAYPPNGWKSMSIRFADPSEEEEVDP